MKKLKKLELNTSQYEDQLSDGNQKKSSLKKIFVVLGVVTAVFFVSFLWSVFFSTKSIFHFSISQAAAPLKSTNGRVNILLLGVGGGTHEGPDLTDSIIVASFNLQTKNALLFSIPRDLWLDNIKQRVNAAYPIGKAEGHGLSFAEDKIDDVLGITIHYGVKMDFDGFAKAIDLVDGVDINVENSFDDYEYPITGKEDDLCNNQIQDAEVSDEQAKALGISPGKQKVIMTPDGHIASTSADFACRFEHLHFNKGLTHMDGQTALKYVRSRHALGVEGSDFARSRRQQLVIEAFRGKALSLNNLFNPQKIGELYNAFSSSVETDIPKEKLLELCLLSKSLNKTQSIVLGDLGNNQSLFINPNPQDYGGAWVLVPKDNDFGKIAEFVKSTIASQDNPQPTTSPK